MTTTRQQSLTSQLTDAVALKFYRSSGQIGKARARASEVTFDASDWLVDRHVRQGRGGAVAIQTGGRSVSYAELADQVAGVAGMFVGLGVGVGDRVLLMLLDGVEFVATFLGVLRMGAVRGSTQPFWICVRRAGTRSLI
ncbi:MAG: AMP-binding protein [Pseudonocardiaceae bacterium]